MINAKNLLAGVKVGQKICNSEVNLQDGRDMIGFWFGSAWAIIGLAGN